MRILLASILLLGGMGSVTARDSLCGQSKYFDWTPSQSRSPNGKFSKEMLDQKLDNNKSGDCVERRAPEYLARFSNSGGSSYSVPSYSTNPAGPAMFGPPSSDSSRFNSFRGTIGTR